MAANEHDYETTLNILGVEFDVVVTYCVTSHGASAGMSSYGGDPAEPPEFYIDQVVDQWGNDITDFCDKSRGYTKFNRHWRDGWFLGWHTEVGDKRRDHTIEGEMFGVAYRKFVNPYMTYLEILEEEIMDNDIDRAIDNECEEYWSRD